MCKNREMAVIRARQQIEKLEFGRGSNCLVQAIQDSNQIDRRQSTHNNLSTQNRLRAANQTCLQAGAEGGKDPSLGRWTPTQNFTM